MKFVKMHGAGNDYVYINGFEQAVEDPARLARGSQPTAISASAATG